MKRVIAVALGLAIAAGLSISTATADPGKKAGPFAGAIHADVTALLKSGETVSAQLDRGKVTAADSGSLTIERPDNESLTFALTADTVFRHGSASSLKVGDKVGVVSQDGTALRVNIWRGQSTADEAQKKADAFRTAVHADIELLLKDGSSKSETMDRGKVTAINSSSLTIERPDGVSVTFSINGDTAVREKGKPESLDDIEVGDRLMVFASGGQAFLLRCISHPKEKAKS